MRITFFTLFLLAALSVTAQETVIENVTKGYNGVFSTQDDNVFYTYYILDKPNAKDKADLKLRIYNQQLVHMDSANIEINKNARVISAAISMHYYYFILSEPAKKTITTIVYEKDKGIIKNTSQTNLSPEYFSPEHFENVYPAMPEGFIVVSEFHGKKSGGYKVARVNREMKEQWAKTYTPEKGNWDIQTAFPVMERVILLRKEKRGNNTVYAMQCINADMGDEMYTNEMKDDSTYYTITNTVAHMDQTSVAGLYYKNNESKEPAGVFFKNIGPGGEDMKVSKVSITEITQKLNKDVASKILNGSYKIYPQDLTRAAGGFLGIAELYSDEGVFVDEKAITIRDLLLFHFGEPNGPETADTNVPIDFVPKKTREITVKGPLGSKSDVEVAEWLNHHKFFSYRAISEDVRPRLIFRNDDSTGNKVFFWPIDDSNDRNEVPFVALARGDMKDIPKETGKSTIETSDLEIRGTNRFVNRGIIPLRMHRAVYFKYDGDKVILWVENML